MMMTKSMHLCQGDSAYYLATLPYYVSWLFQQLFFRSVHPPRKILIRIIM